MIDLLFREPILGLIQQWPFVFVLIGILYYMRRDILDCHARLERLTDRLLAHLESGE